MVRRKAVLGRYAALRCLRHEVVVVCRPGSPHTDTHTHTDTRTHTETSTCPATPTTDARSSASDRAHRARSSRPRYRMPPPPPVAHVPSCPHASSSAAELAACAALRAAISATARHHRTPYPQHQPPRTQHLSAATLPQHA
eukprot:537218-Prymnesium_polylepis.2